MAKVVCKNAIIKKIMSKIFDFILNIVSFPVQDARPFHLMRKLLFYYQEYFEIVVKIQIRTFGLKSSKTKYLPPSY